MQKYLDEHCSVIEFIHNASKNLKLTCLPKTTACILYHKVIRKQQEKKERPIDKYVSTLQQR